MMEAKDLGNFNLRSKKTATGNNNNANNSPSINGTNMVCPKINRYPKINIESSTQANFT